MEVDDAQMLVAKDDKPGTKVLGTGRLCGRLFTMMPQAFVCQTGSDRSDSEATRRLGKAGVKATDGKSI